jgi:type I restriction enzyme S subunit
MQQLLTGETKAMSITEEWKEMKLASLAKEKKQGFNDSHYFQLEETEFIHKMIPNKKDISNSDKAKYKKICNGDITIL